MPIAVGVKKTLAFKKQSALGTIASGGASTGQYMRRVTSTIDLSKATFKSNEILVSQQRRDFRHGVRSVSGSVSGELSVGGYQSFFESFLRQTVQAAATSGAQTNITSAVTSGAAGTFTRAAGSYLTDGFKIGDVVQWTGWATTGTANNSHNFLITNLTALVMTVLALDGVAVGAKAAGDSVTCTLVGKKTWVPASGHTRDYYTIEHFYSDISQSEVFTDCVITSAKLNVSPTDMAKVEWGIMGLNMTTAASAYFSSPTAAPTGAITAGVNGSLIIGGAVVAYVSSLTLDMEGSYTVPGGVVGANVDPDIFPGGFDVSGQMTLFFVDATYRDIFVNETETSATLVLTGNNTASAPFMAITMSRIKFGGATKDDGEKGILLTVPFTALENVNGGAAVANLQTTISIQDSSFT
ncbi:MAG: phage tail tube protein [Alphaproteobacteria bacterium]